MGYDSDLTDMQWLRIEGYFENRTPGGRKRKYTIRSMVNAILYVLRGGIPWRMLPNDFPPWRVVHNQFMIWQRAELWDGIFRELTQEVRRSAGKKNNPSYAVIDSQSVKTTYAAELTLKIRLCLLTTK
ncbi:MAG: transposase [Rickettsiales bacterium]